MPRHRPVHDDDWSSHIRNGRQRYATDDWEAPYRICDAKPDKYTKTYNRVRQLIMPVYLFQTPFVERAVVRHQRQSLDKRSYFTPNVRKIIGFLSICRRKPMYFGSPSGIIIRIRTYKSIYFIDHRPALNNDHSYAAHTGTTAVCRLKIDCCKIFHRPSEISVSENRQSIYSGKTDNAPSNSTIGFPPGRQKETRSNRIRRASIKTRSESEQRTVISRKAIPSTSCNNINRSQLASTLSTVTPETGTSGIPTALTKRLHCSTIISRAVIFL